MFLDLEDLRALGSREDPEAELAALFDLVGAAPISGVKVAAEAAFDIFDADAERLSKDALLGAEPESPRDLIFARLQSAAEGAGGT